MGTNMGTYIKCFSYMPVVCLAILCLPSPLRYCLVLDFLILSLLLHVSDLSFLISVLAFSLRFLLSLLRHVRVAKNVQSRKCGRPLSNPTKISYVSQSNKR